MAEQKEQRIKVVMTPAGNAWSISKEYRLLDYIADGTTMYICVKVDPETGVNVGHELTDTRYWNKCIDFTDAMQRVESAISAASTATATAKTATDGANLAANKADSATANAKTATDKANTATTNANSAAERATSAATSAESRIEAAIKSADTRTTEAVSKATTATTAANEAKVNADTATSAAKKATTDAQTATSAANAATTKANNAATDAESRTTAAVNAATAATNAANEAKTKADSATANANSATEKANTATASTNAAITASKAATAEAEKVNAAISVDNTLSVTNRKGEVATVALGDAIDVAQLKTDVASLQADRDSFNPQELGYATVMQLDMKERPTLCGFPFTLIGDDAPAVTPDFIGQEFIDTKNGKVYKATNVNNAGGWKPLN